MEGSSRVRGCDREGPYDSGNPAPYLGDRQAGHGGGHGWGADSPKAGAERGDYTREADRHHAENQGLEISEQAGREEDDDRKPPPTETGPPQGDEGSQAPKRRSYMERSEQVKPGEGMRRQPEDHDDRSGCEHTGDSTVTATSYPRARADHCCPFDSRDEIQQLMMHSTDENGDRVKRDVDQPERVKGKSPMVEQEVPAGHGLALEDDGGAVGARRERVHRR
jgi:hypothetical protein